MDRSYIFAFFIWRNPQISLSKWHGRIVGHRKQNKIGSIDCHNIRISLGSTSKHSHLVWYAITLPWEMIDRGRNECMMKPYKRFEDESPHDWKPMSEFSNAFVTSMACVSKILVDLLGRSSECVVCMVKLLFLITMMRKSFAYLRKKHDTGIRPIPLASPAHSL
jgi:hypothetical protein